MVFKNIFKRKKLNDIIKLNNEFGEELKFHFLNLVEYKEKEYVILLPIDSNDGMVVILEILSNDNSNTEEYIPVENENILQAVYTIFKDNCKDVFDFVD